MRNGYINEQIIFVSRKTYTVIAKDILHRCIYYVAFIHQLIISIYNKFPYHLIIISYDYKNMELKRRI